MMNSSRNNSGLKLKIKSYLEDRLSKKAPEPSAVPKFIKIDDLKDWTCISTGCVSIDFVTRGGIPVSGLTEIVGCSGVGKTQLCLQLALMAQLPSNLGGVGKSVIYICTEDVFPAKRLRELSEYFQNTYRIHFEDNIFIKHIARFDRLKECLSRDIPALMNFKQIGLIVIDSIAGLFRSENSEVNYASRSQDFVQLVAKLIKLPNVAIVCTNQVADNLEMGSTEPCLGLAWSTLVTTRFNIMRLGENPTRQFEVIFAPHLPCKKCEFQITKKGVK